MGYVQPLRPGDFSHPLFYFPDGGGVGLPCLEKAPNNIFVIALFFFLDLKYKKNDYRIPQNPLLRIIILFLLAYSILGYPLVGWILKHPYMVELQGGFSLWVPILGLYPCPTTIFAIALLAGSLPRADIKTILAAVSWALPSIAGKPIVEYKAYEDLILFLAGIYGLVMAIRKFMKR